MMGMVKTLNIVQKSETADNSAGASLQGLVNCSDVELLQRN